MPQINLGTVANDGTGSPLRSGGLIINQYGLLGDKTVNAAFYKTPSITTEAALNLAIPAAALLGSGAAVWVPASMLPYNASLVTFNTTVKMLAEGRDPSAYDPRGYGAAGDNATDDTSALRAMVSAANANRGRVVFSDRNTYLSDQLLVTGAGVSFEGKATLKLKNAANNTLLWVQTGADDFRCHDLTFDGNVANQSHTANLVTPFNNNTALVQIQSQRPIVENVTAQNTALMGLQVGGNTDASIEIDRPIVTNCRAVSTGAHGIFVSFAVHPFVQSCFAAFTGGGALVALSNVSGTTLTTATSFSHLFNQKIGVWDTSGTQPVFVGSITKSANPNAVTSFSVSSVTLLGGTGTLTTAVNRSLLSAPASTTSMFGIQCTNCWAAKIENCATDFIHGVGIGIINDRGAGAVVVGCVGRHTGEEAVVIDGCRRGHIVGCNEENASVNSTAAPNFQIANHSAPGISDPIGSSITGCTSHNGQATQLINCGLYSPFTRVQQVRVEGNYVWRDNTKQWATGGVAIQCEGPAHVANNFIYGVDNGIAVVDGDGSHVVANLISGTAAASSYGIYSNNASRTTITGNKIGGNALGFTDGVKIDVLAGWEVLANNFISCTNMLNASVTDAASVFLANSQTGCTNVFKGGSQNPAIIENYGVYGVYLSAVTVLTDAATIATDASKGHVYTVTLNVAGATRAVGVPSNARTGQRITHTLIQDATGGRAVTWNAVFKNVWSDTGNTLNKRSSISHIYDGTNWNQDGAQTPYV